jgi:hypothetical protein
VAYRVLFLSGQHHPVAAAADHPRPNPTRHFLMGLRGFKKIRVTYDIIVKPVSIVIVIIIVKVFLFREHFIFESFACEIVDGTRYYLYTSIGCEG